MGWSYDNQSNSVHVKSSHSILRNYRPKKLRLEDKMEKDYFKYEMQ